MSIGPGQRTRLAARGKREGVDDGHEDAAGTSSGGGHGGRQAGLCNAQPVCQAQRALSACCHKQIGHPLPQTSLLEALHASPQDYDLHPFQGTISGECVHTQPKLP